MNETVIWILLVSSSISGLLCLTLVWQLKMTLSKLFEHQSDNAKVLGSLSHVITNLNECSKATVKTLDSLADIQKQAAWENKNDHEIFHQKINAMENTSKDRYGRIHTRIDDIGSRLPQSYTARAGYAHPSEHYHDSRGGGLGESAPPYRT